MVRQRKVGENARLSPARHSTKPGGQTKRASSQPKFDSKFTLFIAFNAVLILSVVFYVYYLHYLESWVIRPVSLPKVVKKSGLDVPERFWGSYRSALYFGMKTRSAQPLVAGLMWFSQKLKNQNLGIRHWCSQWDGLEQYGWVRHDGVNFGVQRIVDEEYLIETSFVKRAGGRNGGDWTARIAVKPKEVNTTTTVPISLLFYVATDGQGQLLPSVATKSRLEYVSGQTDDLGKFTVHFLDRDTSNVVQHTYLSTVASGLETLHETVLRNLVVSQPKKGGRRLYVTRGSSFSLEDKERKRTPNFVLTQVTVMPPYEMEVVFESASFLERPSTLSGEEFDKELLGYTTQFDERFNKVFKLPTKGFSDADNEIAKEILSNMVGGIGYFHGSSLVQSSYNKEPVEYWKAGLYTAVPSRSFFPRGFLWDEGFHNLLLSRWDPDISKDIISHWLDLMNVDGWIPREQILGTEARSQVPAQYVVQRDTNANPPAMFFALEALLNHPDSGTTHVDFLRAAFPRFLKLFDWLNTTQAGKVPGTYRWRGRDATSRNELNPKTLTSGLDDYPRASHPTEDERHVDLRCWLAFSSGVLSRVADLLKDRRSEHLAATHRWLSDAAALDRLHLSPESGHYCDYGLHTDRVRLVEQKVPPGQHHAAPLPKVRLALDTPRLQFVQHFGYVSLFPLLLRLLAPENPALGKLMTDLRDPSLLWTDFGLRSLSKNSPMYMKYNTDTDPPYWRGPVWININYLAVRALYHYSELPGPFQEKAFELYKELRGNIIRNMLKEYRRSKYIWENYKDSTGQGQGSHPFTGWSALLVLIMGEMY
uniref:Mannosyl-oligosaccharide glucosidase n=1 Tax=Ixodes ricinus TaxID=34613 RepID=A0A131Y4M3_IXORI